MLASAASGSPLRDELFTLVAAAAPAAPRRRRSSTRRCRSGFVARLREFDPDAVIVQSAARGGVGGDRAALSRAPREGRSSRCTATGAPSTRLYGSRTRRAARPFADRLAAVGGASRGRGADGLGLHDRARARARASSLRPTFPAFMDLEPFLGPPVPLPERPRCALRRRARALQERRRARGRVAARVAAQVPRRIASADRRRRARRPRAHARRARPERHLGVRPRARGGRRRARRRHVPRAPVAARGHGPRRRRGVLPRPGGRRRARRAGSRTSSSNGVNGLLVDPRTTPTGSRRRSRGCCRIASWRRGLGSGAQAQRSEQWFRRLRSTQRDVRCARRPDAKRGEVLRVLLVARTRYRLPLSPSLERKFEALGGSLELRVLATAADRSRADDGMFRSRRRPTAGRGRRGLLRLAAAARSARAARLRAGRGSCRRTRTRRRVRARPASRTQQREGRRRAARRLAHGDAALRRRAAPPRSRRSPTLLGHVGVRRADAVRTLSDFTTDLVREARRRARARVPRVHRPRAFYRDRRAAAPRAPRRSSSACSSSTRTSTASPRRGGSRRRVLPDAQLRLVGRGSRRDVVERARRDLPAQTTCTRAPRRRPRSRARSTRRRASSCRRAPRASAAIVIEAFCAAAPVVASARRRHPRRRRRRRRTASSSTRGRRRLADALVRVLSDRDLAERLAAARGAARRALDRDAGGVRRARWRELVRHAYTDRDDAPSRRKQLVKNALYRTIGETSTRRSAPNGDDDARCGC